ncbi:hypothetical protein AVEN_20213-1 [Araneus ventricosus]|uniref:Uncharacterized protein n=1 Tax=Araneus ventricosus TaxID=182803 RepID=A0A4Y2CLH1_ARAVE|nr:hypothetical protein AVEN_20213-1 [Araneus ventricosus]
MEKYATTQHDPFPDQISTVIDRGVLKSERRSGTAYFATTPLAIEVSFLDVGGRYWVPCSFKMKICRNQWLNYNLSVKRIIPQRSLVKS